MGTSIFRRILFWAVASAGFALFTISIVASIDILFESGLRGLRHLPTLLFAPLYLLGSTLKTDAGFGLAMAAAAAVVVILYVVVVRWLACSDLERRVARAASVLAPVGLYLMIGVITASVAAGLGRL